MQAKIDTGARRRKLPVSSKPVWASVGDRRSGLKLGYRKGTRGGVWVGKLVESGARVETTLGQADDDGVLPGDGLSYIDAMQAAVAWAAKQRVALVASANEEKRRVLTVADAINSYVKTRIARDELRGQDARTRLAKHVLGDARLSAMPFERLTARTLTEWRARLPGMAPAGVNRLLNDVRAALNGAVAAHWRDLPATIGKEIETGLKALPNAETARQALLIDADIRRIVEAAYAIDSDLGALVLVLAATGARFGQAAKIAIADFQPDAARVMVPTSAKGRGVKQRRRTAVPLGQDAIDRLRPLTIGRKGHEPLLTRWLSRQIGPAEWEHVGRAPWTNASEMSRGWRKALAAADLPRVEPYALRHSSIVRGLRAGLPPRIVAALHDTSSAMIERHYSAFILDLSDELARRALVPLTSAPIAPLSIVA
jgi:integrase